MLNIKKLISNRSGIQIQISWMLRNAKRNGGKKLKLIEKRAYNICEVRIVFFCQGR